MLQRTVDGASALVGSVQPGELTRPTPCEAWDVRALLNHMVVGNQMIAGVMARNTAGVRPHAPAAGRRRQRPGGRVQRRGHGRADGLARAGRARAHADDAVGANAAGVVIGFHLLDQVAHSWDLAKALGRGGPIDADLAEAALAFARQSVRPEMRGPKSPIGKEVPCPANAPAQDRLAAFLGRQP